VDFRKQQREHAAIYIDGTVAEKVESFKFLSAHITDTLKWSTLTDRVVKKAQKPLFNLRRLKECVLATKTLPNYYRYTIESILSGCITTWYGNGTARDCRVSRGWYSLPNTSPGGTLSTLQNTYSTRYHRKDKNITNDINHPSHGLFTPLSSRR
jgi:hypothetical protein